MGAEHCELNISQRHHFLTSLHWDLSLNQMKLRGTSESSRIARRAEETVVEAGRWGNYLEYHSIGAHVAESLNMKFKVMLCLSICSEIITTAMYHLTIHNSLSNFSLLSLHK